MMQLEVSIYDMEYLQVVFGSDKCSVAFPTR